MAEAAGLVLGGIPLVIWALEKYAEPLSTFRNYRKSIKTLQTNLALQNQQLKLTLSDLGLGTEPSRQELQDCFCTKFPDISHHLIFIVQHMEEVIDELMKNLDIDFTGKV
ncbi:hypothetical protein E5D57_012785 [Metarhizium anisopliae]|nr:hypothetical protein E5D57_012785 [Metarhizium anisopliae]